MYEINLVLGTTIRVETITPNAPGIWAGVSSSEWEFYPWHQITSINSDHAQNFGTVS